GGHRAHALDHAPPIRQSFDDLRADRRQRRDRDPEHDTVEVSASLQHADLDVGPRRPGCLERRAARGELAGLDELVVQGSVRPAGQTADVHEGLVFAAPYRGLAADRDRFDSVALRGGCYVDDAVEELEADAAPAQDLVEGREYDVAHPRAHL